MRHSIQDNKSQKSILQINKLQKKEKIFLTFTIIFFLIVFIILNQLLPMLLWDENAYLSNTRNDISKSSYTEDYKYPLIEWTTSLVWVFTGESLIVAKLLSIAFTIGAIVMMYLISRKYLSLIYSSLATWIFALSPLILYWGFRVYSDIPAIFYVMLSFYCLMKYEENGKAWLFVAAGVLSAMAFLERFTQGLFILCVIIYYLSKKDMKENIKKSQIKNIKKTVLFSAIILISLMPWLIYNQLKYHNPVWDFEQQYVLFQEWNAPAPAMNQINNLFTWNNPLIPCLMLFGIFYFVKKKEEYSMLIIPYTLLSFVYYVFLVNYKDARYYISFLPFIYLLAFYAIEKWREKRKNHIETYIKYVSYAILIITIVVSIIFLRQSIASFASNNYCQKNQSILESIKYLKNIENVKGQNEQNLMIISNAWPWYGYYLNANVSSTWDSNITHMVHTMNADYVTYTNIIGIEYSKETLDQSNALELEKTFKGNCNDITYVYKVKKI